MVSSWQLAHLVIKGLAKVPVRCNFIKSENLFGVVHRQIEAAYGAGFSVFVAYDVSF